MISLHCSPKVDRATIEKILNLEKNLGELGLDAISRMAEDRMALFLKPLINDNTSDVNAMYGRFHFNIFSRKLRQHLN